MVQQVRALVIGVHQIGRGGVYGGVQLAGLRGTGGDTQKMVALLKRRFDGRLFSLQADRFDSTVAGGTRPASNAVDSWVNHHARELSSSDLMVVYFSGHGMRVSARIADEEPDFKPAWCLEDKPMLVRDVLANVAGVASEREFRLLLIADCCHAASREERMLPQGGVKALKESDEDMINRNLGAPVAVSALPEHKATVIQIAACELHEQTYDGVFTDRFVSICGGRRPYRGTYRRLADCIAIRGQHPQVRCVLSSNTTWTLDATAFT